MENKKGTIKRHVGKIEIDSMDHRVMDSALNGIKEAGYEVVAFPMFDKEGRVVGEVAEIYWIN